MQLRKSLQSDVMESLKVKSVNPTVIHYIVSGRNAWHSTWIRRYSEGCMHTSVESAINYCEKWRNNGDVFCIYTIPALLINSDGENNFLITEVNSENPLQGYSSKEHYLYYGGNLGSLIQSFTKMWEKEYQQSDLIVLTVPLHKRLPFIDEVGKFDDLDADIKSKAISGTRPLEWDYIIDEDISKYQRDYRRYKIDTILKIYDAFTSPWSA